MRKFLIKTAVFYILSLLVLTFLLIRFGGKVDPFYQKFTVPRQSSLILGDSRSIQGIQPDIIDRDLKDLHFDLPMFNYSFTTAQIAYGKPYTESIKKKLKPSSEGLFIVSVHPWLFAARGGDDLKSNTYSEENMPPHNIYFANINPNFEYFLKNYKYFNFENIFTESGTMHKNGWMEESDVPKDPKDMLWWTNRQHENYAHFGETQKKSLERVADFIDMIKLLKKNGRVVLVRIPIDDTMLKIEDKFWPDFDHTMNSIADKKQLQYFNFSHSTAFKTYDGNHLDKRESGRFTHALCDSIKIK